jgi:hypothetical protein
LARLLMIMLLCIAATGCELIADFDRSKIPDERPGMDAGGDEDAAVPDSSVDEDATIDAGADEDAGSSDEDAG